MAKIEVKIEKSKVRLDWPRLVAFVRDDSGRTCSFSYVIFRDFPHWEKLRFNRGFSNEEIRAFRRRVVLSYLGIEEV